MKVLVTGGAGFIGSHLVDALLGRNDEVVVLDDLSTGKASNLPSHRSLTFVEGSVTDAGLVAECAQGCDAIAHLAAVVSVQDSIADPVRSHAVNLTSTVLVLEAAKRERARVVFASSAAVYGDNGQAVQKEGEEGVPISPYGIQKLGSEHYLRVYGQLYDVQGVSFRQFNVYGPRQDPSSPYSGVISIFCCRLLENRPLTVYGDGLQTRDFIYVRDVVESYLRAFAAPHLSGGPVNIGTGAATSVLELAHAVKSAAGSPSSEIGHAPAKAGDIRYSCADIAAFRDSGLAPDGFTGLEAGLQETLAWYADTVC